MWGEGIQSILHLAHEIIRVRGGRMRVCERRLRKERAMYSQRGPRPDGVEVRGWKEPGLRRGSQVSRLQMINLMVGMFLGLSVPFSGYTY